MDSTLPLYRQLSSRFLLLALSFCLLSFAGFSLYFQHDQNLAVLKYQQLPAIEKYHQRQRLLIRNERLINDMLVSNSAAQFDDDYQTLNKNLKNISALSDNNRQLLAQLTQRLQLQAENVTRLTQSERRNIQLKDSVIIQLSLVADSLASLIARQTSQQKDLYRQVTQDNLTDRVTAIRAKALSNLANSLSSNRELHRSLIETLAMFNQLDLQCDLVEFDYIQQYIQGEISHRLVSVNDAKVNDNNLLEKITVLNALLFSEQQTFAKWRGQLRRAKDFQVELSRQKVELMPLLDKSFIVQPIKSSVIEQLIINGLAKVNIRLQAKHYIWIVAAAIAALIIIFTSLLFSIRRKIKCFGTQSTAVVTELVTKGKISSAIPALEIKTITNVIKQLPRPEHSESDFKQQQQQYQTHTATMARCSGHVFWQLPELSKQKQPLCALLGIDVNHQYWRQCFSRADVRAILSIARKAQKQLSIEKISLISQQNKAMLLTIEYVAGVWSGSLCNVAEYRALKDENSHLKQQLRQQNQADKLAVIASIEDASVLISAAMIQRQMLSLTKGDEQLAYQQLRQLVCWSEQQKIRAQLRQDDFVLTLSTVNLANELHTALVNVSLNQAHSNNFIYLNLASNLVCLVTLESALFQAMISTICQEMLHDQHGVELDIDVQVIDVNSAQQIVRMSFQLHKPTNVGKLSQVINALVIDDESNADFSSASNHYLRDLQLVFNVTNKQHQQLELAGKFSFELPLAIADDLSKAQKNKPVKLAKCQILVIATNKNSRQRICHQLINSKAVVETMQDLSLFKRQTSIKNLTQHRLDAIILSPEVYGSDFALITQHLASLPAKIQPKVLVIQPLYDSALTRAGLFSVSNLPWFSAELVKDLTQLLNQPNTMNLLLEPEVFSPYRFLPTQVEVLLAVATSSQHQTLIRILQWFGLQVTLVSRLECFERLWQSGRYLVAITEFLPFKIEINASVTSVRGVFALTENDSKAGFFKKLILPKLWHSGYLAPVQDIKQLTEQLSPWLTPDSNICLSHAAILSAPPQSRQNANKAIIQTPALNKADVTLAQEMNIADIDLSLDFPPSLEQENKSQDDGFDLTKFADNQGSAELAAFMLDEYLADINSSTLALSAALKQQDYASALQHLQSLIALTKVIAAGPLFVQCRQLSELLGPLLGDKNLKEPCTSKQKEQLQQQLNQLKLCLVQLTEFAESI
tara:strand:- start:7040 stop:10663 length:3624 start_codon:yes stop_codon:yes gene_type:complete